MRRAIVILVLVGAVSAGIVLTGASGGGSDREYWVQFNNAFGLVEGGDLKVGGVRVGQTTDFKVDDSGPRPLALVKVKITEPGFGDFRADARCRIRPQSLIGEYFVDCQPGSSPKRLPEGGVVPVENTEGTINQDLINNILRRPYRERFRLILAELGTGLAGRPQDLNEAIRRAHPGLRETDQVLRILANQNRIIENFIRDSDTVVAQLERRKRDVARWVTTAGRTAEISASRREDLARQFERFPRFLDELRPTMAALERTADEQIPLLRDLRHAAPDLREFFTQLGPFADASLPSLRALGRAAKTGSAAIDESSDEVRELRKLAAGAPAFAKPLSQFLRTIDDRNRYTDPDPRAAETAPPAPDPTSDAQGKGFTGMESILNYPYWQTLSVNQYDQVGHMLRVVAFESECGDYSTGAGYNDPDPAKRKEVRDLFARCRTWVGPDQPGLTAPDPTNPNAQIVPDEAQASSRRTKRDASRAEDVPAQPSRPDAEAKPGQRDPSKPQVVLPPGVRELVERIKGLGTPQPQQPAPRSGDQATQLLDFLLAP